MKRGAVLLAPAFLLAPFLLAACTPPTGPLRMPIESIRHSAACATPALRLLMLPGAYSRAADFEREGFLADLRARGIDAEVVLVDAHYGYYADDSIVARLASDFLSENEAPPTWIVGISLGGFGAMAVAGEHPGRVAGVFAISPYPGTRDTQREIAVAGGLAAWATATPPASDDGERRLWRWLAGSPRKPLLYAGLADADRFIDGQRLLTSTLPADRVDIVPGGHDWPAWRALWQRFLAAGVLPATACTAGETQR
jgi:pimeloyl-ACP methyl ester carboxylesterase